MKARKQIQKSSSMKAQTKTKINIYESTIKNLNKTSKTNKGKKHPWKHIHKKVNKNKIQH